MNLNKKFSKVFLILNKITIEMILKMPKRKVVKNRANPIN
jgi:hypothetical protein